MRPLGRHLCIIVLYDNWPITKRSDNVCFCYARVSLHAPLGCPDEGLKEPSALFCDCLRQSWLLDGTRDRKLAAESTRCPATAFLGPFLSPKFVASAQYCLQMHTEGNADLYIVRDVQKLFFLKVPINCPPFGSLQIKDALWRLSAGGACAKVCPPVTSKCLSLHADLGVLVQHPPFVSGSRK